MLRDVLSGLDAATAPEVAVSDVAAAQDAVMASDAPPADAPGLCDQDSYACGCATRLDCLDAGSCCCYYPGISYCDLRHDCPINGGMCY
jgi:hypothetical protein